MFYLPWHISLSEVSTLHVDGYLYQSVQALLADKAFEMPTASATSALKMAQRILKWIPSNVIKAKECESKIIVVLRQCIQPITLLTSSKTTCTKRRTKMWSCYHTLRTSEENVMGWVAFLRDSCTFPAAQLCPILYQYLGHHIFRNLIKDECGFYWEYDDRSTTEELTYEELNALRYTAGYVPRALKKKISAKKSDPRMKDLLSYLNELISDGSELHADSSDWIALVNRGGLISVNNMTFELFHTLECEFRQLINSRGISDHAVELLSSHEDVLFLWSIISSSWDSDCSSELLDKIKAMGYTSRIFFVRCMDGGIQSSQ